MLLTTLPSSLGAYLSFKIYLGVLQRGCQGGILSKLSVEFDDEEWRKIDRIKKQTGIKSTTELIRFLITEKAQSIAMAPSPR